MTRIAGTPPLSQSRDRIMAHMRAHAVNDLWTGTYEDLQANLGLMARTVENAIATLYRDKRLVCIRRGRRFVPGEYHIVTPGVAPPPVWTPPVPEPKPAGQPWRPISQHASGAVRAVMSMRSPVIPWSSLPKAVRRPGRCAWPLTCDEAAAGRWCAGHAAMIGKRA